MSDDLSNIHFYDEQRRQLIDLINWAKTEGQSISKTCQPIQLPRRRYQRWNKHGRLNRKPSNTEKRPYNALTSDEIKIVHKMIACKEYADASCRELSIKAFENENVYISHVTFWEYMKEKNINGPRGIYAKRIYKHQKSDTSDITAPNEGYHTC